MRTLLPVVVSLVALSASAEALDISLAFERLESTLRPEVEEGRLSGGVAPILFVSATPAFESTRASYPAAALGFVVRMFGAGDVRACEACMNPRLYVEDGRMEHNSVLTLEEIIAVDARTRGNAAPAKSAIWLDQTPKGVAVRIVSLTNGQVLFAGNFDGDQVERQRSSRNFNATLELDRRMRGETLTHIFMDAALYPGQHISIDFVEQFGKYNENLAGLTISVLDPVFGVGVGYYRVIPEAFNLSVGGQIVASVPTAIVTALTQDTQDLIDPLLTGVLVARMPIPHTSYAVLLTGSTNGVIGVGVSLMNFSFLPVLP